MVNKKYKLASDINKFSEIYIRDQMRYIKYQNRNVTGRYRGRLVHSVLLINANIMQIQTMTQIQLKNPAAYFNTRPRL